MLDKSSENYILYVTALETIKIAWIPVHELQVAQITTSYWDKASIKIPGKCTNYTDIFFLNLVIELPQNTSINKYIIKVIESKRHLYGPIYTLSLMELGTWKIYIKTYLKTRFIGLSRSPADELILFIEKSDGSLHLCINH